MEKIKANSDKRKKTYLLYTTLFGLISLFIIIYLLINGKTNINTASDGMNQHYRAMLYYSRYLKQIVTDLFNKHKLIMPHWSLVIGEGSDIISTLHSDAVGDPLTFLSVLIPERFLPEYYMFNTFIRVYLAGIFFIMLCLYMKKNNEYAIVGGALTYSFCFWSLESITHHIYFLTPLMILPLMILGLEKILNKDDPFTFVLSVFWGSISWLYFFYMEAAVTAIYGVIRLFTRYGKDIKTILLKLAIILVHAILGVCLAMIVLFPMISAYLGDNRMGIENVVSLLYPRFFYERLLTIFLSNDSAYDLCMGYAAPSLFALVLAIKNIRRNSCLALSNICAFIFVCLPFCGKALNGFSFASQRWSFAIALPVAYSLVEEWDEMKENKKLLSISYMFFVALALYSAWSRSERVFVPLFICLVFLAVSCYMNYTTENGDKSRQAMMVFLVLINIFYLEQYSLSSRGGDVINDLLSIKGAHELPYSSEAAVMKNYIQDKEKGFYRYTGSRLTNNAAMTNDVNSTAFYWSITNSADQQFRLKLGLQDYICWQINGYDDRTELETLANVKYYICEDTYKGVIPYGFEQIDKIDDYIIYNNRYCLPFGYTYDNAVSYEDWNSLSMLEKQNTMMRAIVVKDGNGRTDYNSIKEIPYSISCGEGIEIRDNKIFVSQKNAEMVLKFEELENGENYLELTGLDYEDTFNIIEDDHTGSTIVLKASNGVENYFSYLTKSHHYYFGKSDYVAYFGKDNKLRDITISFSLIGEYTFDQIRILNESLSGYERNVASLAEEHLENVAFSANEIYGDIDLSEDKYLLLSIPYSKGWKAYVDGSVTELLQANEHYIGLRLAKGHHEIYLKYSAPGLKTGALLTFLSFIGFVFYFINYQKKKRVRLLK